ncbi:Uncharacterized conserved protein, DUF1501 family [Verrucomicrobium sp. GAS474]|uniref:DUF1501 domain-containing protein n=1 Tax=Verrucomicrobium sp. GAS474 TaxID=1882831 RepID=UPI00087DC317|nr:DUF1501 domain-containing protein [Verrucomicrobium sp. GAS474]SDU11197.1 Uncharacterized conserved protein, DUF1501 family [Verrucomicrobium sp. GAS474]
MNSNWNRSSCGEICLHTRRNFLRSTLLGAAMTWTVPTFLAETFSTLHLNAADSSVQVATGKDSSILVILQLAGGNDGLNTVVPYSNDFYYKARPTIGLPADKVIKLDDTIALNPSLTGFKGLFDEGHLSIVQGVGYPNPNRSHFRATEILETASDSESSEKYGWLGRYFDNACPGSDPTVGVAIAGETPQAFWAPKPRGVTLKNPGSFRFMPGGGMEGAADETEGIYRELNKSTAAVVDEGHDASGGSIGSIGSGAQKGAAPISPLNFIERTALDAQASSDKIQAIAKNGKNLATYPNSGLANDLKLVSRLIGGGLTTRVYFASQGGYDTHTNQVNSQARLLQDLGDSLAAFCADLKAQGNFDRVTIMTFSEFGRRVNENGSQGTDHGVACPQFLIGGKVKGGLAGTYPSLDPAKLDHGDLVHTVDFRSVYAGLLEGWLQTPSAPILNGSFDPLVLTA